MARTNGESNGRRRGDGHRWSVTKEKILMASGLAIIFAEFISAEVFGDPFHFEFLLVGLTLCGVSITQWGDKH